MKAKQNWKLIIKLELVTVEDVKMNSKICTVCKIAKRTVDDGLCNKCFNKIEDLCKHTGMEWNEAKRDIKSQMRENR